MEMVQFHPSGMVKPEEIEGTLVTEAVRGEGGKLINNKGELILSADDNETASANLIWGVYSQPSFGTATVLGTGASPTTLNYVPDGNFSGIDSFIVKVTDLGGIQNSASKSDTIIIHVEVAPVNDPPVFKSTPTTDQNGTYRWNDESSYVYEIKTFEKTRNSCTAALVFF